MLMIIEFQVVLDAHDNRSSSGYQAHHMTTDFSVTAILHFRHHTKRTRVKMTVIPRMESPMRKQRSKLSSTESRKVSMLRLHSDKTTHQYCHQRSRRTDYHPIKRYEMYYYVFNRHWFDYQYKKDIYLLSVWLASRKNYSDYLASDDNTVLLNKCKECLASRIQNMGKIPPSHSSSFIFVAHFFYLFYVCTWKLHM